MPRDEIRQFRLVGVGGVTRESPLPPRVTSRLSPPRHRKLRDRDDDDVTRRRPPLRRRVTWSLPAVTPSSSTFHFRFFARVDAPHKSRIRDVTVTLHGARAAAAVYGVVYGRVKPTFLQRDAVCVYALAYNSVCPIVRLSVCPSVTLHSV